MTSNAGLHCSFVLLWIHNGIWSWNFAGRSDGPCQNRVSPGFFIAENRVCPDFLIAKKPGLSRFFHIAKTGSVPVFSTLLCCRRQDFYRNPKQIL